MSENFRLYVAFVNGIPILIGTLNSISKFCNVRLREVKKLVPQKWRHGGRPRRKPKAQIKKCGYVIEIRRFISLSAEEMESGKK